MLNENGIIMEQIIKLLSNIEFNRKDIFKSITNVLCIIPKIATIALSKYLINNLGQCGEVMLNLFKKLLYNYEEVGAITIRGQHMINEIKKTSEKSWSDFRLLVDIKLNYISIYKMRFLPESPKYKLLMEQVDESINSKKQLYASCMKRYIHVTPNKSITTEYKSFVPNKLFPSNNFKMLAKIINNSISAADKLGLYQTIPILINGEPGLGKSKSLEYLAYNANVSSIYKIDMTDYINHDISNTTIFNGLLPSSLTGNIILLIDEIDKYMSVKCKTAENPEMFNEEILNNILGLIEADKTSSVSIFLIFCSNNFHTMFSYISPQTRKHYESLEDRFAKVKFDRIYKQELFDYIGWLSEKLESPIDCGQYNIPDDFSITFRNLTQYVTLNNFNLPLICETISSYAKEKLNIYQEYIQVEEKVKPQKTSPIPCKPVVEQSSVIKPATPAVNAPPVLPEYKVMGTDEYGPNDFPEATWSSFYRGCTFRSISNDEFIDFIINNLHKTKPEKYGKIVDLVAYCIDDETLDRVKRIMNPKDPLISNNINRILYELFNECGVYKQKMYQMIDDDILQLLQTNKSHFIWHLISHIDIEDCKDSDRQFMNRLNIPGQIPITEWVKLVRTKPSNLEELLKHKYTYLYPCEIKIHSDQKDAFIRFCALVGWKPDHGYYCIISQ